jgi:ABC-type microcin C transport system permease subunit YejE
MTNSLPLRDAVRISELVGLSAATIGALTGASAGTARGWVNGRSAPTGKHAVRLAELAALVDRLVAVMQAD